MTDLRFTLLPDGPSDRALLPILSWLLKELTTDRAIQPEWADLRRLRESPSTLSERMLKAVELYPCDLLFVHRDAESQDVQSRLDEIENAIDNAQIDPADIPVVSVVPVRMQEAWLLFNESAIRTAAGNPNGSEVLRLPQVRRVESLPDPKSVLYELLRQASGLRGRRLSKFAVSRHAPTVSSFIDDFAPLRELAAFVSLEQELRRVISANGWDH